MHICCISFLFSCFRFVFLLLPFHCNLFDVEFNCYFGNSDGEVYVTNNLNNVKRLFSFLYMGSKSKTILLSSHLQLSL